MFEISSTPSGDWWRQFRAVGALGNAQDSRGLYSVDSPNRGFQFLEETRQLREKLASLIFVLERVVSLDYAPRP
jgi:hypothetical protein